MKRKNNIIIVTLDLDDITLQQCKAHMTIIQILGKKRIKEITYRLSSGGHGYHIKILMFIPYTFKETVKDYDSFKIGLRYGWLDCFGRVKSDIARLYLGQETDRLASYKDGNYAGKWETFYSQK